MSLHKNLEKLDSEELLSKLVDKSFTDEDEAIAISILKSRGVDIEISTKIKSDLIGVPIHKKVVGLLIESFKGKTSLSVAFWSVGLTLCVITVLALIGYELTRQNQIGIIFSTLIGIVLILGNPFHAYCVWKCRKNCRSEVLSNMAGLYSFTQILIWVFVIPVAMLTA